MTEQINGVLEKLDITSVTKFQTEDWVYFLDIYMTGKHVLQDNTISYYIAGKGFRGMFNSNLEGYIKFDLNSHNNEPTEVAFNVIRDRKSLLFYNK